MIPAYLRYISRGLKVKRDRSTFCLVCPCGNDRFDLFHNKLTKNEQAAYDRYWNAYEELFKGSYASMCTRDDEGNLHHWKLVVPDIQIEVFPPEEPPFTNIVSWRGRCSTCGAEHLIFDNRLHGYDGMFCSDGKTMEYTPTYVPHITRDKLPRQVEITTENEESLRQFTENTGIDCNYDTYSNAFSWIRICAVDDKGKKTILLDYESA